MYRDTNAAQRSYSAAREAPAERVGCHTWFGGIYTVKSSKIAKAKGFGYTWKKIRQNMSHYIAERITVNPEQCGGRPCIRGMRIRVVDVLELLAAGLSFSEVLEELPDLEQADLLAALRFVTSRVNHRILVCA